MTHKGHRLHNNSQYKVYLASVHGVTREISEAMEYMSPYAISKMGKPDDVSKENTEKKSKSGWNTGYSHSEKESAAQLTESFKYNSSKKTQQDSCTLQ